MPMGKPSWTHSSWKAHLYGQGPWQAQHVEALFCLTFFLYTFVTSYFILFYSILFYSYSIVLHGWLYSSVSAGVAVQHPIALARLVLEKTDHVLMAGEGSDLWTRTDLFYNFVFSKGSWLSWLLSGCLGGGPCSYSLALCRFAAKSLAGVAGVENRARSAPGVKGVGNCGIGAWLGVVLPGRRRQSCAPGVMSCPLLSCQAISCHVRSCHLFSCHVRSCRVMSCHLILYAVISCLDTAVVSCLGTGPVMSLLSCHISCITSSRLLCYILSPNRLLRVVPLFLACYVLSLLVSCHVVSCDDVPC